MSSTPESRVKTAIPAQILPQASDGVQTDLPAVKLKATGINFFYGAFQALFDVSIEFFENRITALIGPSGCGKSTFIRNLNRIN